VSDNTGGVVDELEHQRLFAVRPRQNVRPTYFRTDSRRPSLFSTVQHIFHQLSISKRWSWTFVGSGTENAWPSVFRLLSTVGRSHIHTRDRPPPFATHTPLLKHSKTSWLRLTVPPSASTSAPPTPASASGSTTGASLRRFFPSHFAFPPPPQIGASESAPDLVDRGVSGAPKRLIRATKHRRTRIDPHTTFEHVADRAVPPLSSPAASRSSPTTRATAPPRPTSPSPIPSVSSVMPPRTR